MTSFSLTPVPKQLQFTLTISSYHTQLLRSTLNGVRLEIVRPAHGLSPSSSPRVDGGSESSPHRIYLLPNRSDHTSSLQAGPARPTDVLVYAPVPLNSLSVEDARDLDATEAWVSPSTVRPHRHHHRSSSRSSGSGRISLPVLPDEPLLPPYTHSIREEYKQ